MAIAILGLFAHKQVVGPVGVARFVSESSTATLPDSPETDVLSLDWVGEVKRIEEERLALLREGVDSQLAVQAGQGREVEANAQHQQERLRKAGIDPHVHRFEGGHRLDAAVLQTIAASP